MKYTKAIICLAVISIMVLTNMQIHAIKASSLIKIKHVQDIPETYRDTPIEKLLKYQNLKSPLTKTDKAELLIGMCMDNRKQLHIPDNFAFIIRSPGANLEFSHFPISYVIGVVGVKYIAIIGHDDCAMVNLESKKDRYIDGLVKNAEWSASKAAQSFAKNEPIFEIHDEVEFILEQTHLLRKIFPTVTIVPMIYKVKENLLYLIKE